VRRMWRIGYRKEDVLDVGEKGWKNAPLPPPLMRLTPEAMKLDLVREITRASVDGFTGREVNDPELSLLLGRTIASNLVDEGFSFIPGVMERFHRDMMKREIYLTIFDAFGLGRDPFQPRALGISNAAERCADEVDATLRKEPSALQPF